MSSENFYRAFEDLHRGSRELIMERLQVYIPYINPLLALYTPAKALDLGCGRGEWLQLTQSQGFEAKGVDLDDGMLQACIERGLSAIRSDAIDFLSAQPDSSLAIVSGFHIAEHIPFDLLDKLVQEALRVLKPGGLLILETPNPENIVVGTANFYLDPTHQRPIPPLLLEFLPNHHGFSRVSTLRLQEPGDIKSRTDITLMDVLHHVSPDYGIVAQKLAGPEVMALFDGAFNEQRGVDLHNLASRFDQRQNELMMAHHETHLSGLANREALETTRGNIQLLHADVQVLKRELHALQGEFRSALQSLHSELATAQAARDALLHSASWKVTAPLRGIGAFAASPISFTIDKVLKYPRLSDWMNRLIVHLPWLHARLRRTAVSKGLLSDSLPASAAVVATQTIADLSPRAKQIYAALEQEVAHRRG